MLPRILISVASFILFALGSVHLLYTFRGPKLLPRDPALRAAMDASTLVLSKDTTVWRAWLGFNASHSMCAIFFGLVFGYLSIAHPELLFGSAFLQLLGLVVLASFVVLARLYWFIIPLTGVSLALACFLAGVLVARM